MTRENELAEGESRAGRWAWCVVLSTRAHRTLWIGASYLITIVALLALVAKLT